ncbi:MAG: PAS domain-containing protein [Phaeodactylibacter sp.]|nr:PAS domain-containing protein [Phaeodactylibacter sp.]MCB0615093.1 PAS domain-containing protein [Phaeodactylibacter sp.]
MRDHTDAKASEYGAMFQGVLEAILILQEGREYQETLPGAIEALSQTLLLNTAYVYEVQAGSDEDPAAFEFTLLHSDPAGNTPLSAISSGSLTVELMGQIGQGLYLKSNNRRMPAGWSRFLPKSTGPICQLCPIRVASRLVGLLAVSGQEEKLGTDLPLRFFCQSLGAAIAMARGSLEQETQNKYREEKRLRESILSTVPDYIHVYNLKSRHFSYINSGPYFFGHDLIQANDPVTLVAGLVHPDDMETAGFTFLKRIAKNTGDAILDLEYRIRRNDETWAWALTRVRPFRFDENGQLEEVIAVTQDITAKKEQEAELQQSQQMLSMAIEGAKLGIWEWDIEQRLVTYSNRFLEQLGYDPSQFSNQYSELEKLLHPADIPRLIDEVKSQTSSSDDFELDYRLLAKCGRYHWVYDRGQIVQRNQEGKPIKAMGTSIDITDRKEAEIALKESEAIQKAILNALPDLKFRLNIDGVFLDYFATPGDGDALFISSGDFLGRSVKDVFPEYLSKAIIKNLQLASEQGKVHSFEYPLMFQGAICYFEARISAINDQEVIVVVRDITALKQAQQELERKVRELDQNNQKLQKYVDSNLQLENFAHTVSHDLREPIRTVNSFSQLLQKKYHGQLDEDADIFLNFITSSASNMNTLIEDLLEYSRFNNSEHQTEEIPVEQLLQAVTNDLNGLIVERQAAIHICTPLPTIRGNWTKISQVFQNLISNAIKFRKDGELPLVDIYSFEDEKKWAFAIKDNGIGINPEYQQHIFLLFRRLHSRRFYPGSGIGLSLCKRVVEQHGGKIWVESQPGQGATFYFTLPK